MTANTLEGKVDEFCSERSMMSNDGSQNPSSVEVVSPNSLYQRVING